MEGVQNKVAHCVLCDVYFPVGAVWEASWVEHRESDSHRLRMYGVLGLMAGVREAQREVREIQEGSPNE